MKSTFLQSQTLSISQSALISGLCLQQKHRHSDHVHFDQKRPFCRQPLFYSSQPYILNVTLLNPFSVIGRIENEPQFFVDSMVFSNGRKVNKEEIVRNGDEYNLIRMEFTFSHRLWPWAGWLGVHVFAEEAASKMDIASLCGRIEVEVDVMSSQKWSPQRVSIPFCLSMIATPPRSARVLWDQFHSLQYPLGYFPRDDLQSDVDMLDWFGDHIHTNFHSLYDSLRDNGFFVEVLSTDFSCIDPSLYSAVMIVDAEDKFHGDELAKIHSDVLSKVRSPFF